MNKVEYKIYQWKRVFKRNHAFLGLEEYKDIHKQNINLNRYEVTYDNSIKLEFDLKFESEEMEVLETLFRIFNIERPNDFKGYSLSVGDIVEVFGKFFYCDSMGWKEIEVETKMPKVAIEDYLLFEHGWSLDNLIRKKRLEVKDEKLVLKYVYDLSKDFEQFCWEERFEPQKTYFIKNISNI
jgi:hypothetical protein